MLGNTFQQFIKKNLKLAILMIVFLGFGIYLGQNFEFSLTRLPTLNKDRAQAFSVQNKEVPENVNIDFELFWNVWDRISQDYIEKEKVDPEQLYYGAIKGMVAAVGDPYTSFLDPTQNESFTQELSGTFDGVGIQLGVKEKNLVVIAPIDGTPAAEADVRPGDIIFKIDDKDATTMTLPEAVNLIRGQAGTEVKITFVREGETEPLEKTLKRATIKVKSVELKENGDVAVIKLSRFGDTTSEEWSQAVNQVLSKNTKYLVLDLRNNPGGRLQSAVQIVSSFVDKNKIGVIQEDAEGNQQPLFTTEDGRLKNVEVVVLINKGSASASEIVAGALRDLRKISLIGETSFGKGTVQEVEQLDGGSGLHLTTRKWLTPKEVWVHEKGLEPDIKIEANKDDPSKDPQLEKALETVKQ
jgi:carboxyl-terminal processing protease